MGTVATETHKRGRPRSYDHDLIVAAAALGLTHRQIAAMYGCHVETVRYVINKRRGDR